MPFIRKDCLESLKDRMNESSTTISRDDKKIYSNVPVTYEKMASVPVFMSNK